MTHTIRREDAKRLNTCSYLGGRITILRRLGNCTGILVDVAVRGAFLHVLISEARFSHGPARPFGYPDSGLVELCFDIAYAVVVRGVSTCGLRIALVEDGAQTTLSFNLPESEAQERLNLRLVPVG